MLASLINVTELVENFGYPLLFLVVMAESSGVPVPGETGLIAAAIAASQGKLQIELVIAIATLAAIVGDNIGYQIGRKGGRWLLERPGRFQNQRRQVLVTGEPFFERHGPKAVFFGRFLLGLRVWASWLAGATHMRWRSFFLWNAIGGICWAIAIGLLAYFLGKAAGNAIQTFGFFGLAAVLLVAGGGFVAHRRHKRQVQATMALGSENPESEDRTPQVGRETCERRGPEGAGREGSER
ncbi:MAG TPA: DedA family protein [Solirubrobacteraceae bacterium]|jgi:membrane protein DedA with SNARE-associated domain